MIEHDYFGVLDERGREEWSETVNVGEDAVVVSVRLTSAATLESLNRAAAMVMSIEDIDRHARELAVSELSSRQSVAAGYVADVIDRYGIEEIDRYRSHDSGDIVLDVLRSVVLDSVELHPDRDEPGQPFASLRYLLARDLDDVELWCSLDVAAEYAGLSRHRPPEASFGFPSSR